MTETEQAEWQSEGFGSEQPPEKGAHAKDDTDSEPLGSLAQFSCIFQLPR